MMEFDFSESQLEDLESQEGFTIDDYIGIADDDPIPDNKSYDEVSSVSQSRKSGSSSSKTTSEREKLPRSNDFDYQKAAFNIPHHMMNSLKCPKSCLFNCSERITLSFQHKMFTSFWPHESVIKTSKERAATLKDYLTQCYHHSSDSFRFFADTLNTVC
jgi:hypothetical protein